MLKQSLSSTDGSFLTESSLEQAGEDCWRGCIGIMDSLWTVIKAEVIVRKSKTYAVTTPN